MKKHFIILLAGCLVFAWGAAGTMTATAKELPPWCKVFEKLVEAKGIDSAVKSILASNEPVDAFIKCAILDLGYNPYIIIKAALLAGADLQTVTTAALAAGASMPVITRAAMDANATAEQLAGIKTLEEGLGYSALPPVGVGQDTLVVGVLVGGSGLVGDSVSPSAPR